MVEGTLYRKMRLGSIMAKGGGEKRRKERVFTALPVNLAGASGVTRDVSASGIFFETDASYTLGNLVSFTVEFNTPGGKMLLKCRGDIVRIEPRGTQIGVAVKIIESTMEVASTGS